ncbi:MAG TPA: hypothetical protein VH208_11750, partial [Myxococcaceae bacterium]|nr:hypothetical protein [Myxococcaceae bacterium]
MKAPPASKSLLDSLLAGAPVDFPTDVADRARALAKKPAQATAKDVAALPETLALAVLESAVRERLPALAEALAAAPHKALAKAGKKALYQLRSLGVAIAEPRATAQTTAVPASATDALPCILTPVTGNGEQGVVMGRPVRGGVETLQAVFSDETGIIQLANREVSRSMYRTVIREPRERKPPVAIEVAPAEARALLADAAARNLETKNAFPEGTDEALRHFEIVPLARPLTVPELTPEDARLAGEGRALHDQPEVRGWLPPLDALRALALKADEVSTSQLYINDVQRQEQLGHQLRASAEAFFIPQVRQLYAGRLWRMADYFRKTGRAEAADVAAAEARRLAHGPPELSPFGLRLFDKVLELSQRARALAATSSGEEAPAAVPAAPGERRSPG